jgi:hypothetical protein
MSNSLLQADTGIPALTSLRCSSRKSPNCLHHAIKIGLVRRVINPPELATSFVNNPFTGRRFVVQVPSGNSVAVMRPKASQ